MDDTILTQLLDCLKTVYGTKLDSPETLFKMQQNLMEFVMGLGRGLENKVLAQAGTGYRGAIVEKNGSRYKFVGNRATSVHGLFGVIRYERAYYISEKKGEGSWIPLDEQLPGSRAGEKTSQFHKYDVHPFGSVRWTFRGPFDMLRDRLQATRGLPLR